MKKLVLFLIKFFISTMSYAVTTTYMEPGTDATQDLTFYNGNIIVGAGTVTSDTTQNHTGPRSIKTFSGSPAGSAAANTPAGVLSDSGNRISVWAYISALPATTASPIIQPENASSQGLFSIRLQTTGKLNIDVNGTDLSTGTTAISLNTWTRIAVSFTVTNTTTFAIKVYINGVLDSSATNNGTLARTGSSRFFFGLSNTMPVNSSVWYDDIYVDNGSDLSDPGDIRVTAKRPNANGTTNGFTTQIGAGGSGYGSGHAPQVNEEPLSTTNGWSMVGAGSTITEEYNIENEATGDVNIQGEAIVDYAGWVYSSSLSSETAQIILNNGTSNISLTNSNALFVSFAGSHYYPSGTGTDIGEITSTTLTTVSLYECGVLIAYKPTNGDFLSIL